MSSKRPEFETNFQVEKKITTQQSLDMINEAANKGMIEITNDPKSATYNNAYRPATRMPAGAAPITAPAPAPAGAARPANGTPSNSEVAGVLKAKGADAGPNPGLAMFQKFQAQSARKPMVDITK